MVRIIETAKGIFKLEPSDNEETIEIWEMTDEEPIFVCDIDWFDLDECSDYMLIKILNELL